MQNLGSKLPVKPTAGTLRC